MPFEVLDRTFMLQGFGACAEGAEIAALAGVLVSRVEVGSGPTVACGSSRRSLPSCPNGGLCLSDVGEPGAPHGGRRLVTLGNVAVRLGVKAVPSDVDRRGAEAGEQRLGLRAVRHQAAVFDMSMGFLDQPFGRIPGTGGASAGDTLDPARKADILYAKADELVRWPDFDVEEATTASTAGLRALARSRRNDHFNTLPLPADFVLDLDQQSRSARCS